MSHVIEPVSVPVVSLENTLFGSLFAAIASGESSLGRTAAERWGSTRREAQSLVQSLAQRVRRNTHKRAHLKGVPSVRGHMVTVTR